MLLIGFSPPTIVDAFCFIYWSNFPRTFSFVNTLCKMSVKRVWFNFVVSQKDACSHLWFLNLARNSSVLSVYYLWQVLTAEKINYIEVQFKFCGLMEYICTLWKMIQIYLFCQHVYKFHVLFYWRDLFGFKWRRRLGSYQDVLWAFFLF